jgi:hypothetical protein
VTEDFKFVDSGVDPTPDNSDYVVISNHTELKHKVRDRAPHLEKPSRKVETPVPVRRHDKTHECTSPAGGLKPHKLVKCDPEATRRSQSVLRPIQQLNASSY